jgi:hypothetical protein
VPERGEVGEIGRVRGEDEAGGWVGGCGHAVGAIACAAAARSDSSLLSDPLRGKVE